MAVMRDRFLHSLATIVSQVDNPDALREYLRALGRDHRKFGTLAGHYPAVGVSLLATPAHFSAENWTPELSADWEPTWSPMSSAVSTSGSSRP
jgi:hemoglobin-like flavoprotein